MQVCKKINIKNWNNEECQDGGDEMSGFTTFGVVFFSVVAGIAIGWIWKGKRDKNIKK